MENLHSGTTEDMLTLYFESKRGGGREVKEATIMPNGVARVSFESFECKALHVMMCVCVYMYVYIYLAG